MSKVTLKELRQLIREEIARAYQDTQDLGSNDDEIDVGTPVAVAGPTGADIGKVVNRYAGMKGKDAIWTVKTGDGKTVQKPAAELKPVEADKPGEVEKHEPEEPETDNLLVDGEEEELHEVDEKREEEDFKERHYEFLARQIVMKWADHSPEMSWKAVADNYVRAAKGTTGKSLSSEKLYSAIQDVITDMETCRNDGTYSKHSDTP